MRPHNRSIGFKCGQYVGMKCSLMRRPGRANHSCAAWHDDNERCPENMDERQHRIERLDRLQQPDRRGSVDGQGLDDPGLPGLQVDRAVNVDALTPARLLDRELLSARRPAADRSRRIGRMHGVRKERGLVVAQGIQQLFVALNESLLLFFVDLRGMTLGLSSSKPQAMQQRDQS